jgi:hypothetical protein
MMLAVLFQGFYRNHEETSYPCGPYPVLHMLPSSTNWNICVLCQVVTDEHLQCPLRSTKQSSGSGYASLTEDLRFQTLQHTPMDIDFERLDDGDGIESTLKAHKAEWHKKCRLRFNKKA